MTSAARNALGAFPSQALILAAGLGSRLLPVTETTPKPLVPFFGRPLLDWAVRAALAVGCDRIAVNAHHLADAIEGHVDRLRRRYPGVSFHVSREPALLGTGGAVRFLADAGWFRPGPFWVINSDAVFEAPLATLAGPAPSLLVSRDPVHRPLFRLIGSDGPAPALLGLDPNTRADGYAFCGVTLADADLPRRLPEGPSCILRQGFLPFVDRLGVRLVTAPGFFADTGTPGALADAHVRGLAFARSAAVPY